jgi:protection of telomeres protein 1
VSLLSSVAEPLSWPTTIDGVEVTLSLPFVCAKYRSNVRVVDFWPHKLEDFASWRKNTEFDALSNNSASETDSEDEDDGASEDYQGRKIWEWRFALKLEEYDPKQKDTPPRLWVLVDNIEAQMLVSLDACEYVKMPTSITIFTLRLF